MDTARAKQQQRRYNNKKQVIESISSLNDKMCTQDIEDNLQKEFEMREALTVNARL